MGFFKKLFGQPEQPAPVPEDPEKEKIRALINQNREALFGYITALEELGARLTGATAMSDENANICRQMIPAMQNEIQAKRDSGASDVTWDVSGLDENVLNAIGKAHIYYTLGRFDDYKNAMANLRHAVLTARFSSNEPERMIAQLEAARIGREMLIASYQNTVAEQIEIQKGLRENVLLQSAALDDPQNASNKGEIINKLNTDTALINEVEDYINQVQSVIGIVNGEIDQIKVTVTQLRLNMQIGFTGNSDSGLTDVKKTINDARRAWIQMQKDFDRRAAEYRADMESIEKGMADVQPVISQQTREVVERLKKQEQMNLEAQVRVNEQKKRLVNVNE